VTNPCHTCVFFIDRAKTICGFDLCSSSRRKSYMRYYHRSKMPRTSRKGEKCAFYEKGVQMTLRDVFKAQGKIVGGEK
jgi:hypothetical protein